MSTAVVAAGAAAGAAKQPLAGNSGGKAATSKPWWRNALVVVWLLVVYLFCGVQAINTMVALNAQQEISSIVTPNGGSANNDTDANASSAGKSSAKTQLEGAMRLRDKMGAFYGSSHGSATITNNGEILVGWEALEKKFDALEQKFRALPPEIQKAAIEAEAGFGKISAVNDAVGVNYVFMPMAMVTLMMSLWMGALGGAIHMTVEFLRKDEAKSGAWYFFRPFHGALLALAVFIIFQAGQIVLTNPKPEGNAGLNPYVIAFVAIVSGMLTDQAYRRVGLAGSQFLGAAADEKPRWARASVVKDKLGDRKAADLARYMPGILETTAQDWLDGKKDLSEGQQALLAAWLNVERRELFTDEPPAPSNTGGADTSNTGGATTSKPGDTGAGATGASAEAQQADDGKGKADQSPAETDDPAAEGEESKTAASAESAAAAQPPEPEKRAA